MKKLVIVDADLIVYEAAFCVERKAKDGVHLNWYQVSKIVNTIVRKILRRSKATHHIGFLTDGKSNFRVARAFTLPYKGQRKTNKDKPHFYDEIRDYLQSEFGYQIMYGVEADDALTIVSEYYKDDPSVETIIATKDKDLYQYAGHHYNMNNGELMYIDEKKAHWYLWYQMLMGDMGTDNIPGLSHSAKWGIGFKDEETKKKHRPIPCHSYGETKVKKLLDEWDPKDYDRKTFELYVNLYDDEAEDGGIGEERFLETFDLIYMLREAPKDLKISYTMMPITGKDLEFESDLSDYSTKLEFEDF